MPWNQQKYDYGKGSGVRSADFETLQPFLGPILYIGPLLQIFVGLATVYGD